MCPTYMTSVLVILTIIISIFPPPRHLLPQTLPTPVPCAPIESHLKVHTVLQYSTGEPPPYIHTDNHYLIYHPNDDMSWRAFSCTTWLYSHSAIPPFCHTSVLPFCCFSFLPFCHSSLTTTTFSPSNSSSILYPPNLHIHMSCVGENVP